MNNLKLLFIGVFFLNGCSTQSVAPPSVNSGTFEVAPLLVKYRRFELFSQGNVGVEQRMNGTLSYSQDGSFFNVLGSSNQNVGRLSVQPDTCRDDANSECQRRFVVSGQMTAFDVNLNCYIGIRNDTAIGYANQFVSGICQDRNKRLFSMNIYQE